ncbi:hypothetical protein HYC85_006427 [Camellia sinensis]|uniref:KOW domain-containing protein n=1 Tax=Camellia sinensis TaxID=4442 RepID=A0A7J7HMV7_CAMSI|nr:hypothetical protein HYC85_006427 [Camellia sinensis]
MALKTWSNWLEINVNRSKTKIYFVSMSAIHGRGEEWGKNKGENCYNETEPILKEGYHGSESDPRIMQKVEAAIDKLKRRGLKVQMLNITQLSEYRKDAHTTIYRRQWGHLTKEELANPKTRADCIHWCIPGVPDAPKPSSGPHKSRECPPLILILRNRLKYALTYREVISILMQHVVSIPKTNENFRLLYDTKGRFRLHSIRDEEAKFKLCKVRSLQFGQKGIPYINTYDGRTIRYPDPLIKANGTIKLDLETNKITDFIKFDVGNVVMVTGGRNRGRVGVIKNREKHKGNFDTIHVQDATGREFATRMGNVFTIGKGTKPWVSLPKGKGIKLSIIEEARKRLAAQAGAAA